MYINSKFIYGYNLIINTSSYFPVYPGSSGTPPIPETKYLISDLGDIFATSNNDLIVWR